MWGVERRSGPIWIALGASLKAVPLALALVYAGRGEWRKAAVAAGLTALLVAPMLLFDLSGYSTDPGPNQNSLAGVSPFLFIRLRSHRWSSRTGWPELGMAGQREPSR